MDKVKPETMDAIPGGDPSKLLINKFRSCASCGYTTVDKLLQCSSCKVTYYCNAECQRKDWSQHKAVCQQNKQEKPILEILFNYCTSLNRSRVKTIDDDIIVGAILIIKDVQEFLKLDDKDVFTLGCIDKTQPHVYSDYNDFDEFAEICMIITGDNRESYCATIVAAREMINLGRFVLVICAPDFGFYFCRKIK